MLRLMINYVKQHKGLYLLIALSLILYDVTLLVPTQIIQRLVDQLAHQSLTETSLVRDILFLLLVIGVNYGTAYIWYLHLFQSAMGFRFGLLRTSFRKLVHMRTPFYEKFRSGDVMTLFSTDMEGLTDMMGYGLMIVVYAGGMIAFIIPTMFLISWQISLVAILPLLALTGIIYKLGQKQDLAVEENREAVANLSNEVLEVIEGIRVTRAYSKKEAQRQKFQQKTRNLADHGDKIMAFQSLYQPLTLILVSLSTVAILLLGAWSLKQGTISLGQIIALQLYVLSLLEPFWMLSDFILVYQTGKTAFAKVEELIETSDDMEEDGKLAVAELSELALENYSFTYPQAERQALTEISFRLKAGQTLGLVGKTGSGKTTLVRQFLRQYPVGEGVFELNGQDIRSFKRSSIEEKIGYVPQEHILFSKSVGENIAFGKKEASEVEINSAIEQAAFTQDLERMADGLATMIGERGVSISGGQKQRISLARAFLANPDLLILDDSLSAVDAKTEQEIIQHIRENRSGKTTIIVSHRLSAVHHADWILVLDEGRIVEEGRPEQLLEQGGWYYEQYQRQQDQKGGN